MEKTIGIDIEDYRNFIEKNHYYIDKTLLIKDFLDDGDKVTLITRPRCFGKTLNMSMMAEFLDITKDSKNIFKDTNIMRSDKAELINKIPVIFISFKDVKGSKKNFVRMLKKTILEEYRKYYFIIEQLNKLDKSTIEFTIKELKKTTDENLIGINDSIQLLCQLLYDYFGKRVILFIDEYDTPFMEANSQGYYEDIHNALSTLLSTALKGNKYLDKAFLTGIQGIPRANIFGGLNNISVYGVDKKLYGQYFGFVESETKALLAYYNLQLTKEVKEMYGGYRIGGYDVYNPLSISKYLNDRVLNPYWIITISDTTIKKLMNACTEYVRADYETLITKGSIHVHTDLETSYLEEMKDQTFWALFIHLGYLTIVEKIDMDYYKVRISNNEMKKALKDLEVYILANKNIKI